MQNPYETPGAVLDPPKEKSGWRWLRQRWGLVTSRILSTVLFFPTYIASIFLLVETERGYSAIEEWIARARAHGGAWSVSTSPTREAVSATISMFALYALLAFYLARTSRYRWTCHSVVLGWAVFALLTTDFSLLFFNGAEVLVFLPAVLLGIAAGDFLARRPPP